MRFMASRMTDAARKTKLSWLIWPWAIFIALLLAWTGWWFTLSGQTQRALEQAQAGLPDGSRLSYASSETSGYPFRLLVTLKEARLTAADGAYLLAAPQASLAVNPLNPNHLLVFAQSPIRVQGLELDWTITADSAEASVRAWDSPVGEARLVLSKVRIDDPAGAPTTAERMTIGARRDPQDRSARQISVDLTAFQPGASKGLEGFGAVPRDLFAGLVLEQAELVAPGPDPLAAWAQAGAKLRIEQLQWREADKSGVLLAATGAFGLDEQRRPVGAIELDVENPAELLGAVARSSTLDPADRGAAEALAAGQGLVGGSVGLSITAADGRWRLGPIDLGPADPVYRPR
jgi:hypothetical protein